MDLSNILDTIKNRFDFRKEVEVNNTKFVLGLLNFKEEQALASIDQNQFEGVAYFNETRKTLLAFAIKKVDDNEIPAIVSLKDTEGKDTTKEKAVYLRELLDAIPTWVIEQLFDMYVDLREEADANMDKSIKYKWFKEPAVREKERQDKVKADQEASKKSAEATAPVEDIKLTPFIEKEEKPEQAAV